MGLLDLFAVASIPVLKVLIMTSVGSLLATDHVNILGEDARKNLNNVSYFVIYELLHVTMFLTSLLPLLLFILSVPFQLIITYTLQTITNNVALFSLFKATWSFLSFTHSIFHLFLVIIQIHHYPQVYFWCPQNFVEQFGYHTSQSLYYHAFFSILAPKLSFIIKEFIIPNLPLLLCEIFC